MDYRLLRRSFSLIELLIVVAIVSILAAIAVVNFRESGARSKVSRAMADEQTLGTTIESYAVVKGHYPDDLKKLTTPTAFIANVPSDPFYFWKTPYRYTRPGGQAHEQGFTWCVYSPGPSENEDGDIDRILTNRPPTGSDADNQVGGRYDPTNGTFSFGFVIRTNKGAFGSGF